VTLDKFSPYVIINGASQGIINGSFINFVLMFFSALFFGRLCCAAEPALMDARKK